RVGPFERSRDFGPLGHVAGGAFGREAAAAQGRERFGKRLVHPVDQVERVPAVGEALGDRAADPARTTRDQSDRLHSRWRRPARGCGTRAARQLRQRNRRPSEEADVRQGAEGRQNHVPVGGRAQGQAPLLRAVGTGQDVLQVGGGAAVLDVDESERAHGPLIGSETDCVQGPLMLSETCTWPGALYWPNHPTSRSPTRTGSLRVYVYDARRSAGEAAVPWTNSGEAAGVLTV